MLEVKAEYLVQKQKYINRLNISSELILGLHPANKRCRYKVMESLICWAQI